MVVVVVPAFANSAACCLQKSKGDTFGYRSGIGWGIGGTRRRPLAPLPFPFLFPLPVLFQGSKSRLRFNWLRLLANFLLISLLLRNFKDLRLYSRL